MHTKLAGYMQRRDFLALGYLILSTPILAILYVMLPVSPDNALFDYMAWMSIHGAHYYADVAELNWPGIVFIHEIGIKFLGVHFWTYRLTDFIILQVGCLGLFLFLKRSGYSLAPYFVLILYPPLYLTAGIWMSGQRDIVATQLLFLGSALFLADSKKMRLANVQFLAAGLIVAEAVLIRPTYLAYLPVALAVRWLLADSLHSSRIPSLKPAALILLGFFGLLSVILLWSIHSQNLDDWYEQTILFNLEVYAVPVSRLEMLLKLVRWSMNAWHWLALFALLGLVLWIKSRGLLSEVLYVVGIVSTIILSFFVQRKGFIYHVSGLLTVFAVLIAILFDELRQLCSGVAKTYRPVFAGMLIFVYTVAAIGIASKLRMYGPMVSQIATGRVLPVDDGSESIVTAEVLKVAEYIRANSKSDDYVLQWGSAFHIGFLAQRRSSSRFINSPALGLVLSDAGRFHSWLDEFSRDLKQKRPKFVVLARGLVKDQHGQLQATSSPSTAFRNVLDLLSSGYAEVYSGKSIILLQSN